MKRTETEDKCENLAGIIIASLFLICIVIVIPLGIIGTSQYEKREKDHYLLHYHEHEHCELGHRFTHEHGDTHRHSDLEKSKYPKDFKFLWIKFAEFKYEEHHTINDLDACYQETGESQ